MKKVRTSFFEHMVELTAAFDVGGGEVPKGGGGVPMSRVE